MRILACNGQMKGENSWLNKKPPPEAVFCYPGKKKPTADAVGKDNSGWMFTDSECVWRQTGKKQRSRREASESVHLIELHERKLVVTDGFSNKLFHL
ncbi:hypothetical protein [Aeromonas hydrophila]|uniref:hypothetical protein n=1 Tax=Aeromonas hydrophila TaxID=644 RepID=UPI001378BB98|nr:hypothetical protein [Aeromonas hydrophila]